MKSIKINRRKFIGSAAVFAVGSALGAGRLYGSNSSLKTKSEAVSIVRVKDGKIDEAVNEAIELLGGIRKLTEGRDRILLKPNLVAPDIRCTTKIEVVKAVATLLKNAGKKISIGEASAAADKFNVIGNDTYRTRKREILDGMQKNVFDSLGYTALSDQMNIPLINLHSGDIVEVPLKRGFAADSVKIHRAVAEADMVCSIPMMKTHTLATVSLAMKNLIGVYPGTEYYSVRSWLHDRAAEKGSKGVAFEVVDMNHAVKTGFAVIDATSAMEGNGPFAGTLVEMGLIIAGTCSLATDMVGATVMGFNVNDIPVFNLAQECGMEPGNLEDIEIRGLSIEQVKRNFVRPMVTKWTDINKFWGIKEL